MKETPGCAGFFMKTGALSDRNNDPAADRYPGKNDAIRII